MADKTDEAIAGLRDLRKAMANEKVMKYTKIDPQKIRERVAQAATLYDQACGYCGRPGSPSDYYAGAVVPPRGCDIRGRCPRCGLRFIGHA